MEAVTDQSKMLISVWLCSGCAAVAMSCFACGCVDVAVLICLSFADMLESFDCCVNAFDDVFV